MKHILYVLLLSALAACGGGENEEPEEPVAPPVACGKDFVGPLQPGQVPFGC